MVVSLYRITSKTTTNHCVCRHFAQPLEPPSPLCFTKLTCGKWTLRAIFPDTLHLSQWMFLFLVTKHQIILPHIDFLWLCFPFFFLFFFSLIVIITALFEVCATELSNCLKLVHKQATKQRVFGVIQGRVHNLSNPL